MVTPELLVILQEMLSAMLSCKTTAAPNAASALQRVGTDIQKATNRIHMWKINWKTHKVIFVFYHIAWKGGNVCQSNASTRLRLVMTEAAVCRGIAAVIQGVAGWLGIMKLGIGGQVIIWQKHGTHVSIHIYIHVESVHGWTDVAARPICDVAFHFYFYCEFSPLPKPFHRQPLACYLITFTKLLEYTTIINILSRDLGRTFSFVWFPGAALCFLNTTILFFYWKYKGLYLPTYCFIETWIYNLQYLQNIHHPFLRFLYIKWTVL